MQMTQFWQKDILARPFQIHCDDMTTRHQNVFLYYHHCKTHNRSLNRYCNPKKSKFKKICSLSYSLKIQARNLSWPWSLIIHVSRVLPHWWFHTWLQKQFQSNTDFLVNVSLAMWPSFVDRAERWQLKCFWTPALSDSFKHYPIWSVICLCHRALARAHTGKRFYKRGMLNGWD